MDKEAADFYADKLMKLGLLEVRVKLLEGLLREAKRWISEVGNTNAKVLEGRAFLNRIDAALQSQNTASESSLSDQGATNDDNR